MSTYNDIGIARVKEEVTLCFSFLPRFIFLVFCGPFHLWITFNDACRPANVCSLSAWKRSSCWRRRAASRTACTWPYQCLATIRCLLPTLDNAAHCLEYIYSKSTICIIYSVRSVQRFHSTCTCCSGAAAVHPGGVPAEARAQAGHGARRRWRGCAPAGHPLFPRLRHCCRRLLCACEHLLRLRERPARTQTGRVPQQTQTQHQNGMHFTNTIMLLLYSYSFMPSSHRTSSKRFNSD